MKNLVNDLRLQMAQFNNYLIENYLVEFNNNNNDASSRYLFDIFYKLSDYLGVYSKLLEINDIQYQDVLPVKAALNDATLIVCLIEKSEDIDDLRLNVNYLYTKHLEFTINNITRYGHEFGKAETDIADEINQLKLDYKTHFNDDGSFKYNGPTPVFDEAAAYLAVKPENAQVKRAFSKAIELNNYFNAISLDYVKEFKNAKAKNAFIVTSLNVLTIVLMALSYIEPFFEKPQEFSNCFEELIKKITSLQNAALIKS